MRFFGFSVIIPYAEVVALSWKDIDFKSRRIKVCSALESGTDEMKDPKTAAGVRQVPIPDDIYNELLERKGNPFDPVFTQKSGKRYTSMARYRAWDSLKEEIDISMGAKFEMLKGEKGRKKKVKSLSVVAEDFVPYCLRHTYCTDLQDKGVPINVAKYLMGHSNISVTASIYTHISDMAIDTAADLINGKVDGNVKILEQK